MFSDSLKQDLKNPWLRGILLVIATTVSVNVGFISYAYLFPPNLVVQDYYERGKEYFHDQHIRQQAEPTAWRLQLMMPNTLQRDKAATCRLYVMDHQGKPIQQGHVTLYAYHISDATHDFKVELKHVDTGTFASPVSFPRIGKWDLIARIEAGEQQFDTAMRIFVKK